MKNDRTAIIEELTALEEVARARGLEEVADILRIARRTAIGEAKTLFKSVSDSYEAYELGFFEEAIDQLARIAHEHGMPDIEECLMRAREAWDARNTEVEAYVDDGCSHMH